MTESATRPAAVRAAGQAGQAGQPSGPNLHRMRQFIWWSMSLMGVVALGFAASEFIGARHHDPNVLLICASVLTAGQRARLVGPALSVDHRPRLTVEHVISMVLAIAAWAYASAVHPHPSVWAPLPALMAGAIVVNLPKAMRWQVSVAVLLATGAAGVIASPVGPSESHPLMLCLFGASFVAAFILIDVGQLWLWDVVMEVDRARATAGELAVARERLRFASDLHDVQGHHLQAIVLKGELTERLIGRDDEAARAQAAEVTELARTALTDTREVVHGYRHADLRTEISNAVELLRAAGIHTEVHGDAAAVPPPLQQLFGALVREGTTNILRHSQAQRCELVLHTGDGHAGVRLTNDGVSGPDNEGGSGIAGLRERFATLGGEVTGTLHDDGRFELAGRAAEPGGNRL